MKPYISKVFIIGLFSCQNTEPSIDVELVESNPLSIEVVGEEITYVSDSTLMKGYIAYDKNSTAAMPGIIVVHEWWGHNDYARERANKLAALGYVAFAVDMYGDGKKADHPSDAMTFATSVMGDFEVGKKRFKSAIKTLKSHKGVDAEKLAAIGYCFGGSVVLSMANSGEDLDAVAAFHSGLGLSVWPDSGSVKAKVLVCNGADDPFITPEQIAYFKNQLDSAGADLEYVSYPGAVHAFTSMEADAKGKEFNLPLAYNADADAKSWAELLTLLETTFKEEK